MKSWAVMRAEAAKLVERCLDQGQAGVATDQLDARGHYYAVEIERPALARIMRCREQWIAMHRPERMSPGDLEHGFWGSVYLV